MSRAGAARGVIFWTAPRHRALGLMRGIDTVMRNGDSVVFVLKSPNAERMNGSAASECWLSA
jgi:hypothetical protein